MDDEHRCKVCRKSFPSGRSLGGHMRSHAPPPPPPPSSDELPRPTAAAAAAYKLRENPKKTWRYAWEEREKECRQCGKRFPSWKSLFGHMRCHSASGTLRRAAQQQEALQERAQEEEEEEDEDEFLSDCDDIVSALAAPTRKRRTRRVAVPPASSSSSVSEHEPDVEDVALTLMMLSRDVGGWWLGGAVESSDKQSSGEGGRLASELGLSYDDDEEDEFKKPKSYLAASDTDDESEKEFFSKKRCLNRAFGVKKEKVDAFDPEIGGTEYAAVTRAPEKRSEFECKTCNKTFNSYQALGGHRTSHKRCKVSPGSNTPRGSDGSVETVASLDRATTEEGASIAEDNSNGMWRQKNRHQCQTCGKVFPTGQALGGHKRMHYVAKTSTTVDASCRQIAAIQQHQVGIAELLDLNLPATIQKESGNAKAHSDFKPWWSGSDMKHEPLVGLISN